MFNTHNNKKQDSNSKAFTIIELLVVIAIIGLISSVVLVSLKGSTGKAKISKSLEFSQTILNAIGVDAVGIWTFDEGALGVCAGGDVCDKSGYGNHGTITGATFVTGEENTPHWFVNAGEGRSALEFNGTDYVIKNPVNSYPTTEITAEFWMKSSDLSKLGTPISYASSGGGDNDFLVYNYKNFSIYRGGGITTGISANDGKWHHIVVTWKSAGGETKLYKDGKEVYSGILSAGSSISGGGSFVVAQEQDSVGGSFDSSQAFLGLIDEVRIYERALSSSEIQQHYAAGAQKHEIALK